MARPPGAFQNFKSLVAGIFVARPRLIYRAGFHEGLQPVVDVLGLGPLKPTWSPGFGTEEPAGMRELLVDPLFPEGMVRLRIQRPSGVTGTLAVGLGVYPVPANLTHYRVRGTFIGAFGPDGMSDSWAVVVMTRAGTMPDTSVRETQVPVTVQSSWEATAGRGAGARGARMNTVGGAPVGTTYPYPQGSGTGPFMPRNVVNALYSGTPSDLLPPPQSEFSLAQLLDRTSEVGETRLDAFQNLVPVSGGDVYLEARDFINPFIPAINPILNTANVIGTISAEIAIAGSNGPCEVRLKGFTIHDFADEGIIMKLAQARWPLREWFGGLHRMLTRWAFDGID